MGFGCLSIALHETVKLLHYAGAQDVSFIRMGTSGGLGVDPGNIILTKNGYDATLQVSLLLYLVLSDLIDRKDMR